jgi:antitoxin (DNA-binding transcriptional repressor) of toxin-antitoxin stability system
MKYVSLADARTNFDTLLDEVERGETVVITQTGQPVEDGNGLSDTRRREALEAVQRLREQRRTAPHATTEEILQWRDEGRRY